MDQEIHPVAGASVADHPAKWELKRLLLNELKDEDLESILKCSNSLPYREKPETILKYLSGGTLAAFRLNPGLMLLEIFRRGMDKELYIFWMEGSQMLRQIRFIRPELSRIAKENNCVRIGAMPFDERWARKLAKSGGRIVGYQVMMEV